MSLPFNFHHLRYFRAVAREGGLRQAAEKLHVSPPSISAQIKELEETFGEKLFQKKGRANVLTDAGQIALRYADEIFSLGDELANAIASRPTGEQMRLHVGIADALPKLVTNEILRPIFAKDQSIHVICREGKVEDLLAQLATHRLDIVLADEPASSSHGMRAFNHKLGESPVTICAEKELAKQLKRGFPKSLHDAPALLPAESTALRRALENWFREIGVRPHEGGRRRRQRVCRPAHHRRRRSAPTLRLASHRKDDSLHRSIFCHHHRAPHHPSGDQLDY